MADWTDLSTLIASLAAGKAFTDEKAQALAENPAAISESSPDAPVVRVGWHPYDMTYIGDGATGLIYNATTVATIESPDFVDGFEYRFYLRGLSIGATDAINFRIALYRQTAAAYSDPVTLIASVDPGQLRMSGHIDVQRPRDTTNAHIVTKSASRHNTPANEVITLGNADGSVAVTHSTAQKVLRARFSLSSGNFTTGQILMYRRLAL
jgi:hypothetical protein